MCATTRDCAATWPLFFFFFFSLFFVLPALSSPPPPPPTRSFCSSAVLTCPVCVALRVLLPLSSSSFRSFLPFPCRSSPSTAPYTLHRRPVRPVLSTGAILPPPSRTCVSLGSLSSCSLSSCSLSSCSLWCLDQFESHPSIRASSSRIPYIFRTSSLHDPHRNSHSSSVAGHLYRAAVVLSRLYPKACGFKPLSPLSGHTPSSTPPLQGYSHLASIVPCRLTPWRESLPSLQLHISSPSSSLATAHRSTSPSARTVCITLQTISPTDSICHQ